MNEIELKIREVINYELCDDLYKNIDDISKDENLFNVGLDSLNIVKLIMGIEEKFDIIFENEEIASQNWKNISEIEKMVKNKI